MRKLLHSINVKIFIGITDFLSRYVIRYLYRARLKETLKCNKVNSLVYIYDAPNLKPSWAGAITIGRNIFIRWDSHTTRRHELRHVWQGEKFGLMFPVIYLYDFMRGFISNLLAGKRINDAWMLAYRDIRFEAEAYGIQNKMWIRCRNK